MSRSKHTDPADIRAARRLQEPRAPRSQGDLSRRQNVGRLLKEAGLQALGGEESSGNANVEPRIMERRPRPGMHHPATPADIRRTLSFVGPMALYGVRSIELVQSVTPAGTFPDLGRLHVPGRVLLFEQAPSPWIVRGRLTAREAQIIEQAGGLISHWTEPTTTRIEWPQETLRDFMLFDVLLHEIGHHILQHHKGKRMQRSARTKDHEAFADRFVQDCRRAWEQAEESE